MPNIWVKGRLVQTLLSGFIHTGPRIREARNDSQRQVLFFNCVGWDVRCTARVQRPRVRDQSGRLLQRAARERAENYDWQAAAGPERRR